MPDFPRVPKVGIKNLKKVGRSSQSKEQKEQQQAPPAPPPADQPQPSQEAPNGKDKADQGDKVTVKDPAFANPAVTAIQAILESGTTAAQANLLLELTEHLAEGKSVSSVVSDVCRLLIAPGKANAVIKRLAYDAVQVASLHHNDWVNVCQGLQNDLSIEQTLEVQIRVLELITMLPELHVELLLNNTDVEQKLLHFVQEGLPETQGAAAVALAHCYSQPVIVKPLFSSPDALEKKMANWEMVADSANDAVPRVVHGGLVAVSRMIQKYLDAKTAREAGHTSDLQTVLGLMAWAGAVRLRVAGAHVLDRMDAMPASLKVDSITVLISTIDLLMTKDPPPRLDAYGHLIKAPKGPDPNDPFPESPTRMLPQSSVAPPVSDGWLFTAVGKFCLDYLQSPDSALAAEASRALLHLKWLHSTVKFPRLQVAPCPDEWARSAMSALIRVGEPLDAIAAREAATSTICRYLCILPPTDVPAVAKTIIHWIAQRASGSSRVANLLLMWRAVVDTDLSVWKRAQAERLVPEELAAPPVVTRAHANALVEVLELPLMRMLRAGEALEASPTLNQEVVATLFEVLLTHEDVNAAIDYALKSHDQTQVREGEKDDLKACIESAAVLESRLTAVEWSQIALVALQGTQGCLGWDHKREKRQGTYPATLTSDKWFVLASRTQHVLSMLRKCEDLHEGEGEGGAEGGEGAGMQAVGRAQLMQKLVDATHTLQGMFMKVLKFWRSLSPASTPRALWAIVHHLALPAVQEAMWAELLEILRELLLYQPLATMEMHTQELEMSTRTGALPYSVGAQGLKARDRPLLFGGHLLHMPEAADWWDACSEGLAMGALALERICHTLFNNFAEFSHIAGYQRLAHSIASILSQASISLPEAVGLHALCTRLTDVMEAVLENLPEDPEDLEEEDMYKAVEDAPLSSQDKKGEQEGGVGGAPAGGPGGPTREAPKPPGPADHAMTAASADEGGPGKRTVFSNLRQRVTGGGEGGSADGAATDGVRPQTPTRPAPTHPPLGVAPGRAAPAPPTGAAVAGAAGAASATAGTGAPAPPSASSQHASASSLASSSVGPDGKPKPGPKTRSSNVLVSGAKGVGNALRLRKKGPAPEALTSVHELHEQRKAAGLTGGTAPPAQRAAPPAPPGGEEGGRRHTFVAPTRAIAPAAPGSAPTTPKTARAPARQAPRTYIGPILTPLKPLFPHAQEGFPFGAPVAITLADSVRAKRHIVFESQLTSSQQQIWEAYRDPSVRQDHSNTLANLLATVGTLPAPMALAKSIDPASVIEDAGACVMAVPGRFVELTSGHEALRLFACVSMDWAAMQMLLTFRAQSMMQQDMHALTVKVQAIGPAVFVGLSGWNIPKLAALECTSHSLKLAVAGSGAVVLQPAITHKVTLGRGGVERLEVHSAPLRVPITLQLKSPRIHLPADVFFQRFHTWHYSCTVSGTCKWPGAAGGLAVLDIIEKKPFLRIYMHLLPAVGGFQAAYLAYDTTNRAVGLLVCAQLIFGDEGLNPLTAEAADMAAASRCLFRIVAHTASSGAAASMRANPAHWLRELTDGAVTMSVGGGAWQAGEMVPLLSNAYAHAAVQFKKELTPDPEVIKQLQAQADAAAAAEEEKKLKEEEKKAKKAEEKAKKKAKKGGMADAGGAAKLAAFAKAAVAAQDTPDDENKNGADAADADAAEVEEAVAAVQEQVGDDWLHTAVLSHWQMMRDATAAA